MNETCFTIALLLTMGEHDHMWWGAVYNIFLRKAWASAFMLVQCQHELFSDVWRDSNLALLCKPQHPEDCWERTGVSQQTLLSFFRAHLTRIQRFSTGCSSSVYQHRNSTCRSLFSCIMTRRAISLV